MIDQKFGKAKLLFQSGFINCVFGKGWKADILLYHIVDNIMCKYWKLEYMKSK